MPILSLRVTDVGPFDKIEFEFHEQVNLFVGANNCGKSAALAAIGEIVVFPFGLPRKLYRQPKPAWSGIFRLKNKTQRFSGHFPLQPQDVSSLFTGIGFTTFLPALRYSPPFRFTQLAPASEESRRKAAGRTIEEVGGRFIVREPGVPIPRTFSKMPRQGQKKLANEMERRSRAISTHPELLKSEIIIQKMIELDYAAYRKHDPAIREPIETIASVASEITEGFPVEFSGVGEDKDGLFPTFKTPDGVVPFEVLSQGTQSIIQGLGHLVLGYAEYYGFEKGFRERPGILIIDEIDAHLHPAWQQRIIPTLRRHFPRLQIFASTHSPLMLAGLQAGQVQLLRRDPKGKVFVTRNDRDVIGWSADEILRGLIGLESPTDLETATLVKRLKELREKRSRTTKQEGELKKLRTQVAEHLSGGPLEDELSELRDMLTVLPKKVRKSTNRH